MPRAMGPMLNSHGATIERVDKGWRSVGRCALRGSSGRGTAAVQPLSVRVISNWAVRQKTRPRCVQGSDAMAMAR